MPPDTQQQNDQQKQLRQRAEKILRQRADNLSPEIPPDIRSLLHELQVHQIELQMQNEELRNAHEELSRARDRLGDLYHLAPLGYVTIDKNGVILRANYTIVGMLRTEASLAGQQFARFVDSEDADRFYLHRRRAFQQTVIHSIELKMRRADGDLFHARLDTIAGEDNGVPYARVAVTDVTERVMAEQAAARAQQEARQALEAQVKQRTAELSNALERERQARAEAEAANAFKTRLLGMISHELRTPLTSILGFASTLLLEDVTWDANSKHEFLETILVESEKLQELVDQLLQASRLEAGRLSVSPETVALTEVIAEAKAQIETLAAQHDLIVNVPPDLPAVRADVRRIGQVVTNLVKNAAQHSPHGTAITIAAHVKTGMVQVDITDEGPGIPFEMRDRVFEAFWRPERSESSGGAGLGLAICKGLVEAHGGHIWIQDAPPPGTTMSFTLPTAD